MPIGKEETLPPNGGLLPSHPTASPEVKPRENGPRRLLNENQRLDPQKLFELVSQNYDSWLQVLNKQFNDEENFLPFPKESGNDSKLKPIFDYSLLDALDQAPPDFSENLKRLENINEIPSKETKKLSKKKKNNEFEFNPESLLKESEMEFLRNRISELVMKKGFGIEPESRQEGFSLYDTRDEEGLHEGNSQQYYEDDDQDDYNLEEIDEAENFLYSVSPGEHRLQIIKNGGKLCDEEDHCKYCQYMRYSGDKIDEEDEDDDEPSCEFTFEYDANGKLVHTDNNIEEKLRMMNLHPRADKNVKLPSISELNIEQPTLTNSKSKRKKKKKSKREEKVHEPGKVPSSDFHSCLFCEYEDFYGEKPREMIKWYNRKVKKDEQRRLEIKRKLENAKLRALKRQRDLRQRKLEESGFVEPEGAHDSEAEEYRSEEEVNPPNYTHSVT